MKASRRKKISCLLLIGLMFIGLLSFKNIYAEGEPDTPVPTGDVTTGETNETTGSGETEGEGSGASEKEGVETGKLAIYAEGMDTEIANSFEIDLYRIASIGWDGSSAKYTFTPRDGFQTVFEGKDFNGMTVEEDADTLNAFANDCTKIIRETDIKPEELKTPVKFGDKEGTDVPEGVYIGIIRNPVPEGKKNKDCIVEKDGAYISAGEANGNDYLFKPVLCFVTGDLSSVDMSDEHNVKYSVMGSLTIKKNLDSYNKDRSVTFVYLIQSKQKDGTYKDIDYVSITFEKGASTKLSTPIKNIPIDTEVVITEVYSGSSYHLSNDESTKNWTITLDEENQVEFTNKNDGDKTKGYGIKNVTYQKEDGTWDIKAEEVQ